MQGLIGLVEQTEPPRQLLRLKDFAERIGYKITSVYKKINRGQLDPWLVYPPEGGHPRIDWTAYQRDMRRRDKMKHPRTQGGLLIPIAIGVFAILFRTASPPRRPVLLRHTHITAPWNRPRPIVDHA